MFLQYIGTCHYGGQRIQRISTLSEQIKKTKGKNDQIHFIFIHLMPVLYLLNRYVLLDY